MHSLKSNRCSVWHLFRSRSLHMILSFKRYFILYSKAPLASNFIYLFITVTTRSFYDILSHQPSYNRIWKHTSRLLKNIFFPFYFLHLSSYTHLQISIIILIIITWHVRARFFENSPQNLIRNVFIRADNIWGEVKWREER